jgi:hypothetical protein
MSSNLPPGYSDDGDAISHGRDSAMYQQLMPIRVKFDEWQAQFRKEFYGPEMEQDAAQIEILLDRLADSINVPL